MKRNRRVRKAPARKPAEQGVDQRLAALAARTLAGERVECAWELFRLQYFPGWKPPRIAGELGAWARRHGIEVAFDTRRLHNVDMIFLILARCSG